MEENIIKKDMDDSNKNVIIAILIVIIVALIGALVYFVFIKEKPTDNNGGNNQQQENNNQGGSENKGNDVSNIEYREIEINKINYTEYKNDLNQYEDIRVEENDDNKLLQYSIWNSEVKLTSDGKVQIVEEGKTAVQLSNISNGKAIQGGDGYFYILLNNGDVYYYESARYSDGNYTAVKVKGISDISKFVESSYCSKEEQLCANAMGVVDKNDMYIELESLIP